MKIIENHIPFRDGHWAGGGEREIIDILNTLMNTFRCLNKYKNKYHKILNRYILFRGGGSNSRNGYIQLPGSARCAAYQNTVTL